MSLGTRVEEYSDRLLPSTYVQHMMPHEGHAHIGSGGFFVVLRTVLHK